eukprot:COSAG05_NODE_24011_length_254_cov_0.793548_1_plen_38_part_01
MIKLLQIVCDEALTVVVAGNIACRVPLHPPFCCWGGNP